MKLSVATLEICANMITDKIVLNLFTECGMNKSETTSTDDDPKIDASSEVNSTKFQEKKTSNKISLIKTNADKQKVELSKSKTNEDAKKSKKTKESDSEEDEVKGKHKNKLVLNSRLKLDCELTKFLLLVPLLDQPIIIEGSRSRKTIISLEKETIPISKKFQIEIPNGKGIPLGRIPIVNTRMKVSISIIL